MKPIFSLGDLKYSFSLTEQTIDKEGYRLRIEADYNPSDPREWDNVTTLALFHGKYRLANETTLNSDDYDGWDEMETAIKEQYKPLFISPVSMYDHSGTVLSLGIREGWDSGRVGFLFVTPEQVEKIGVDANNRTPKKLRDYAEQELKVYDQYLSGDVYSFTLEKICTCSECGVTHYKNMDSCGGFFGNDPEGLLEQANEFIQE